MIRILFGTQAWLVENIHLYPLIGDFPASHVLWWHQIPLRSRSQVCLCRSARSFADLGAGEERLASEVCCSNGILSEIGNLSISLSHQLTIQLCPTKKNGSAKPIQSYFVWFRGDLVIGKRDYSRVIQYKCCCFYFWRIYIYTWVWTMEHVDIRCETWWLVGNWKELHYLLIGD